ncbi:hypothetical protein BMS3Abin07_00898 [bacterium BMS3Abin07]|nr:hypothetical protein BMS3Abin07_00898 [bacterium BMS3Abin07]GBE32623.1 hypothetical protein BMS3Bbin05_01540 [bacterium BMS3Bbin05]
MVSASLQAQWLSSRERKGFLAADLHGFKKDLKAYLATDGHRLKEIKGYIYIMVLEK